LFQTFELDERGWCLDLNLNPLFALFQVLLPLFGFFIITEDALDNLSKQRQRHPHHQSASVYPDSLPSPEPAVSQAAQLAVTPWSPT